MYTFILVVVFVMGISTLTKILWVLSGRELPKRTRRGEIGSLLEMMGLTIWGVILLLNP